MTPASTRRSVGPDGVGALPPATPLAHLGPVDGLRAIAVVAVLLYHFDVAWLPGGFLGVEVFFVISGFLITSLLTSEYDRSGTVRLRSFWWRRIRRLVPALLFTLACAAVATRMLAPGEFARLRGEILAALTYVSNWFLIARGVSYFDSFARPSPLRHLWSLAIEEQYYLVWPPLLLVASRRFSRRTFIGVLAAASAASTAWMAVLFEPGEDPSRAYFGLDSRLGGLLVGSILALSWRPGNRTAGPTATETATETETDAAAEPGPGIGRRPSASGSRPTVVIGWLAATGLVVAMAVAHDTSPWLYRGGFAAVAILTAALITASVTGVAGLSGFLGSRPAQWVGRRSYALYLVHWPIVVFTRPDVDVHLGPTAVFALRVALTAVAAEACHRLVELPLRALRHGERPRSERVRMAGRGALALSAAVLGGALILPAAASTDVRDVLADLPEQVVIEAPTDPNAIPTLPPTSATTPTTPQTTLVPPLPAPEPVKLTGPPVLAVGDSVMLRSAQYLAGFLSPFSKVDAKVSRQFGQGADIISFVRGTGYPIAAVVVHLGTNGPPTPGQVDRIVAAAGPVPVLLLNTRVFRQYQDQANTVLADAATRHPNVRIVDWYALSAGHPEWFESDLVHTNNDGVRAYVGLITASILSVQLDPVLGPTMTVPPTTLPPPTTTTTTTAPPLTLPPPPVETTVAPPPTDPTTAAPPP